MNGLNKPTLLSAFKLISIENDKLNLVGKELGSALSGRIRLKPIRIYFFASIVRLIHIYYIRCRRSEAICTEPFVFPFF